MLRWSGHNPVSGAVVLGFGIDAENVRRLQAGNPIVAKVSINGEFCQIVIHYGATVEDLKRAVMGKDNPIPMPQALDEETDAR